MSAGPTIREATLADVPALHRFAKALFDERLPTILADNRDLTIEDEEAFVRARLDTPGWLLLIAVAAGQVGVNAAPEEVIGVLEFRGRQSPRLSHSGEIGISVQRDWRGRGIGTRLLAELEGWVLAHGFRRIELSVFASNVAAIRLYERLGYEREGCRRGAVRVGGEFIDLIEMAKVLL